MTSVYSQKPGHYHRLPLVNAYVSESTRETTHNQHPSLVEPPKIPARSSRRTGSLGLSFKRKKSTPNLAGSVETSYIDNLDMSQYTPPPRKSNDEGRPFGVKLNALNARNLWGGGANSNGLSSRDNGDRPDVKSTINAVKESLRSFRSADPSSRDDRNRDRDRDRDNDDRNRDREDRDRRGTEERSQSPSSLLSNPPGSPPLASKSPLRSNSRDNNTNSITSKINAVPMNQNTYIQPVTGTMGSANVSPIVSHASTHPSLDLSGLPERKRSSIDSSRNPNVPVESSPLREPFSPGTPKSNTSAGNRSREHFEQAPGTPKSTLSDETRSRNATMSTAPTTRPPSNILTNDLLGMMPQIPGAGRSESPSPLQSPITPSGSWGGGVGGGDAGGGGGWENGVDLSGMMAMMMNGMQNDTEVHASSPGSAASAEQRGSMAGMMGSMDELFLQLLISQAVIDAKEFEVLTLEEVEELKKDHINLTTRVANLTTRLSLESKIREAAHSLTRLHATNKRLIKQANEELSTANRKVDQVATELWKLTQRGSEVQKRLLQHMAGVLGMGIRKLEEEKSRWATAGSLHSTAPAGANFSTTSKDDRIAQLESQLNTMQQTMNEQQSTLASKDRELEALRTQLKSHALDDTTEVQLEEKEREIAELRSELEQVSTRLDFVVRKQQQQREGGGSEESGLEIERDRSSSSGAATHPHHHSHNTAMMAQLSGTLSALEEQLSEYQTRIHQLEGELETVQEASKKEKERRGSENENQNIRTVLQNSLRDAMLEKERMRVQMDQEKRKREEMEKRMNELEEEAKQAAELRRTLDGKNGDEEEVQKLQEEIDRLERIKVENAEQLEKRLREAVADVDQLNEQYEDVVGTLKKVFGELPDVAEGRKIDINSSKDEGSRKEARRFSMDAFVGRVQYLTKENQRLVDKILDMQSRMEEMQIREDELKDAAKSSKKELEAAWTNVESVKAILSQLELTQQTASSELTASTSREHSLQADLEQARGELSSLKQEKLMWEQTMKRQSVLQVVQDGGASMRSALEQQLAAQEQEYQAQLKERDAVFNKVQKELENYKTENAKLEATSKDLEELLREKIRTLDGRDVVISRFETEMAEINAKLAEAEALVNSGEGLKNAASEQELVAMREELMQAQAELTRLRTERETFEGEIRNAQEAVQTMHANLQSAQAQFTERETALEKQSVNLQNEFDGILKEFDRLTRNFVDFESERQRYEGQIDTLHKRCQALETELADERIKHMGMGNPEEVASTATLRKEFRKLMSELRTEQQKVLNREVEEKKKMEALVRDMKREREMVRWEKVNKGVQTGFVAVGV